MEKAGIAPLFLGRSHENLDNEPLRHPDFLINKNQCGVSMETSDIEDIAQEIIAFKNMNSEEYGQYCENARKTALEYDYKNLTLELLEIFKRARENRSKNSGS